VLVKTAGCRFRGGNNRVVYCHVLFGVLIVCYIILLYYIIFLTLKGYLSSVWISIKHSVMVSGFVYIFMGSVVRDWSCAVEFTNYGGPHWGVDNYRLLNYLADFAENWLKGVCKVSTCVRMTPVK